MPDALYGDDGNTDTLVGANGRNCAGTNASTDLTGVINGNDFAAVNKFAINREKTFCGRCLTRKPLAVVHAEEEEGVLERTLGFWDLFALGFGGTVGSGVFVMTGLICHELAGPAGMFSWVISGFGCLLSGVSFAELSWRVPSAGGAYAYTFVALGELPAAVVGWCMTLEYGISAAAVAKSWGEMLSVLVGTDGGGDELTDGLAGRAPSGEESAGYGPGGLLDMGGLFAAALQIACVLIVVGGLKASKITVNVFCVAKGLLVLFMTMTAFALFNEDNLTPVAPFGARGVLKGAVAAFFGYLGFDEVVLLSPEAKNPAKHVPTALFASLAAVTVVCALASLALSGAMPAPELDADAAFSEAFRTKGLIVAYKVTAIGELATLPLVVLVSFMAQPRLLFAMAKDGLLPELFAEVDSRGTLLKGSLASGAVCVLIAACIPFDALDGVISAGVLFAFNLVTSSLLVLRHSACVEQPREISNLGSTSNPTKGHERPGIGLVMLANLMAFASSALAIQAGLGSMVGILLLIGSAAAGLGGLAVLSGLKARPTSHTDISEGNYLAPLFPWLQGGALWVNWFLVCQLPLSGLVALGSYIAFAVAHYACYGASHSVGNCSGWSLVLTAAATAKDSATTSHCTPFSTMDPEGLAGVTVEDGVAAPLLGEARINGDTGSDATEHMLPGGTPVIESVVSDSQPSVAAVGAAHSGSGRRMAPLVRRRSAEGLR